MHDQVSVQAKEPQGGSHEIQNRGSQWPHKVDLGPTIKHFFMDQGFYNFIQLTQLLVQLFQKQADTFTNSKTV